MGSNSTNFDKPRAKELGWTVRASTRPFANKRFTAREDQIVIEGRAEPIAYAYAERAAGVLIIPVTAAGEIVMIRQYRYPVDQWCLEIPAGSSSDTGAMPLEEVVLKELMEEIGATASRVERVSEFFSAPAYSNECCVTMIAWGVELTNPPEPEPTEQIRIEIVPMGEALQRAESGAIENGPCALALLQARRLLEREYQVGPSSKPEGFLPSVK